MAARAGSWPLFLIGSGLQALVYVVMAGAGFLLGTMQTGSQMMALYRACTTG